VSDDDPRIDTLDEPKKAKRLFHIVRARLPWREGPDLTECGRAVSDTAAVWTRDEAVRQFKALGQQRFALMVCMNCKDTTGRWPTWEDGPVGTVERECQRVPWGLRMGRAMGYSQEEATDAATIFERELRALAALVEAHSEEFRDMVEGLRKTVDLSDLRAQREYRKRMG
jgi:hypothetical protein